jgi:hypothetical protein
MCLSNWTVNYEMKTVAMRDGDGRVAPTTRPAERFAASSQTASWYLQFSSTTHYLGQKVWDGRADGQTFGHYIQ